MKTVYIIIVTHNGMPWINKCLETCKGYQVIVVDNASSDQTVLFIKQNYPEVEVLEQTKNLGFGQANNLGMRYALDNGADYVFLLNQDAYLQFGTVERLMEVHCNHPEFGIVSPVHLNGEGNALDYNFLNFVKRSKTAIVENLFLENNLESNRLFEIDFVNAAFWMISKECLKRVGGFNPYFFQYGEDRDYVNRVHYKGFKVGILLNAFGYHDRAQEDSISKSEKLQATLYELFMLNPFNKKEVSVEINKLRKQFVKNCLKLKFKENGTVRKKLELLISKKDKLEHFSNSNRTETDFLFL